MEKRRIFTHQNLDLDAVFSVLAVIKYCFKETFSNFFSDKCWRDRIILVKADWNGNEMLESDIAVDIEAGGKGKKGEVSIGERVDSAFLEIMNEFAPFEDQRALENIVLYINEHDATGSAIGSLIDKSVSYRNDFMKIFHDGSIEGVFRAAQSSMKYNDPKKIVQMFSYIFEGYLINGRKYLKALSICMTKECKTETKEGESGSLLNMERASL